MSLFFYGWWNVAYVPLLGLSIAFNYAIGRAIAAAPRGPRRDLILGTGIVIDLAVLGYFKYAEFFVGVANSVGAIDWTIGHVVLPLGISFFTFTQITYLVDARNDQVDSFNPVHYAVFVTYFPHLIAGPLLHHREMITQFEDRSNYRPRYDAIAAGLTMFAIGLFKKVMIADDVAAFAAPVFAAPAAGLPVTFIEAWCGALAYTLQLYFDFSGYCDMAIGVSLLFGVKLPINFNSPYKSLNVIDFWRRWHMTLSRFLRDYLYIPLGGNRHGVTRRYINLAVTMLLGGLWHGAGWTFIIWGGLHGLYLVVNHGWQTLRGRIALNSRMPLITGALAWAITFVAVVVAWVFFRAPDMRSALAILTAMSGAHGIVLPSEWANAVQPLVAHGGGFFQLETLTNYSGRIEVLWLAGLLMMTVAMPNSQQIVIERQGIFSLHWRPSPVSAVAVLTMFWLALLEINRASEFLYFDF
ncbi:MBOAT family O-acyltransferase [Rhodoplanes sp. Z2-YC6860]|uniref:MBOAT family O-acyltransferase n=1 Tax=Rhodoplanes sp. Z2-YC6860 TaxID=674703 RepID=UPI0018DE7E7B|nr:MBOAT family O-acyltransferase [Rhodoplanes sp. Z2-YC6860]